LHKFDCHWSLISNFERTALSDRSLRSYHKLPRIWLHTATASNHSSLSNEQNFNHERLQLPLPMSAGG
jgi:hypothetical protein